MLVIVCYDVNTETREGRRRLRRVARICESRGQRVQKSVFECQIDRTQFEALEQALINEIKATEDNLRFYRIAELRGYEVREYGSFRAADFDAPLVL